MGMCLGKAPNSFEFPMLVQYAHGGFRGSTPLRDTIKKRLNFKGSGRFLLPMFRANFIDYALFSHRFPPMNGKKCGKKF
jgi:hypothetical protein